MLFNDEFCQLDPTFLKYKLMFGGFEGCIWNFCLESAPGCRSCLFHCKNSNEKKHWCRDVSSSPTMNPWTLNVGCFFSQGPRLVVALFERKTGAIYDIIFQNLISYCIISYDIISHHIISYHIISCHTISYHVTLYYITLYYCKLKYNIMSYHIVSYHTILYCVMLQHIILCYIYMIMECSCIYNEICHTVSAGDLRVQVFPFLTDQINSIDNRIIGDYIGFPHRNRIPFIMG